MQQAPQQSSWVEQLLKPLFDHLGLNGADALKAAQQQNGKPAEKQIDPNQLRRQGWSEKDIEAVMKQAGGQR